MKNGREEKFFMKSIVTKALNTPRLILRKITKEDAENLFSAGSLGKICKRQRKSLINLSICVGGIYHE